MAPPNTRFAYQIVSDADHRRAIETVNQHTTQGWRARQMCIDPRDGSLTVLLELKYTLEGKQRLSKRIGERELRAVAAL